MSADFLDTNVIIYMFDIRDGRKRDIARTIVQRGLLERTACISHQVVQEALNVLSRPGLEASDLPRLLNQILLPLWRTAPSPELFGRAIEIQHRHRFSFYDSLIVAAALEANCNRLLTEDLQHGQRIESLVIENPFRELPSRSRGFVRGVLAGGGSPRTELARHIPSTNATAPLRTP